MMKDADLKRNASGYYDEPCYKAITAPPKAGEIWSSRDGSKCWLILQNHGGVCSTLLLGTEQKEGSITVMGRVPMYTTPVMVGYTFSVYVATFVKRVPDEKMDEIRQEVGKALGITGAAADQQEDISQLKRSAAALAEKVVILQNENNELKHENADLRSDNKSLSMDHSMAVEIGNDLHAESISLSKEIDRLTVFKEMYMDLIDKLVSVRGGAIVND